MLFLLTLKRQDFFSLKTAFYGPDTEPAPEPKP
jgi:hypothetical protein